MLTLGYMGTTTVLPVTSASDSFLATGPAQVFVVKSDRKIHLAHADEATFDDFELLADTYAKVSLEPGSKLSFILADGETDGEIRISGAN